MKTKFAKLKILFSFFKTELFSNNSLLIPTLESFLYSFQKIISLIIIITTFKIILYSIEPSLLYEKLINQLPIFENLNLGGIFYLLTGILLLLFMINFSLSLLSKKLHKKFTDSVLKKKLKDNFDQKLNLFFIENMPSAYNFFIRIMGNIFFIFYLLLIFILIHPSLVIALIFLSIISALIILIFNNKNIVLISNKNQARSEFLNNLKVRHKKKTILIESRNKFIRYRQDHREFPITKSSLELLLVILIIIFTSFYLVQSDISFNSYAVILVIISIRQLTSSVIELSRAISNLLDFRRFSIVKDFIKNNENNLLKKNL